MTRGKTPLFGERDQLVLRPQDIVRQFATTEPGIGEKGADAAFNIHPAIGAARAGLRGDGVELVFLLQQPFCYRF